MKLNSSRKYEQTFNVSIRLLSSFGYIRHTRISLLAWLDEAMNRFLMLAQCL